MKTRADNPQAVHPPATTGPSQRRQRRATRFAEARWLAIFVGAGRSHLCGPPFNGLTRTACSRTWPTSIMGPAGKVARCRVCLKVAKALGAGHRRSGGGAVSRLNLTEKEFRHIQDGKTAQWLRDSLVVTPASLEGYNRNAADPAKARRGKKLVGQAEARVTLVQGVEGPAVYINDLRICGPKPWGGGRTIGEWLTGREDILDALGERAR